MLGDSDEEESEAEEESDEYYGDFDEEMGGGYQIKEGRDEDFY